MKEFTPDRIRDFRQDLRKWYQVNHRDLPWRRTRDPYRIWISEIMLQQTRVAAVIPYYERFLARFPHPAALAAASDDELLGAWAGLGYYSRARNLRSAARQIAAAGAFPSSYEEILRLPGIGPYTAAAISSICFGTACAVLDGNVMRVVARLMKDDGDIRSTRTKSRLQQAAQMLLDPKDPATHNQSMMELGATVCIPREPKCELCPVNAVCIARACGLERQLPVKLRTVEIHRVRRTLLVVIRDGRVLLWQRAQDSAMLGGFWELPEPHQLPEATAGPLLFEFSHAITNHIYDFQVVSASVDPVSGEFQWTPLEQLPARPLSTVARKALRGAQSHFSKSGSSCELLVEK